MEYIIMHGDLPVASVTDRGKCHIHKPQFLPWNLWLEEENDADGSSRRRREENRTQHAAYAFGENFYGA